MGHPSFDRLCAQLAYDDTICHGNHSATRGTKPHTIENHELTHCDARAYKDPSLGFVAPFQVEL